MNSGARVEILPVLGRLCFQLDKPTGRSYARAFRLWSLVVQRGRDADSESAVITESDADLLGISSQTLTRHIEEARQLGFLHSIIKCGDHAWRAFYVSQQNVHTMLRKHAECHDLYHYAERERGKVFIPLESLADWMTFCGMVFDAWIANGARYQRKHPGHVLSKLWGISRQQIAKWRKASGRSNTVKNWGAAEPQTLHPEEMPHSFEGSYKGRKYTYYRRSNTHLSTLERAAKGQVRKLRAAWSPAEYHGGGYSEDMQQPVWDTDGPRPTRSMRRNFDNSKALQRVRRGLSDALLYLMVSEIRRFTGWSRMWTESPDSRSESDAVLSLSKSFQI
jgi:hypothetical protein